jgi:hypothetical protein
MHKHFVLTFQKALPRLVWKYIKYFKFKAVHTIVKHKTTNCKSGSHEIGSSADSLANQWFHSNPVALMLCYEL